MSSAKVGSAEKRGPRLSVEQLVEAAAEMRAINLIDIFAAGSGHPGGTLSVMDLAAALYLRVLNHDPQDPAWQERDRVFWSAGHKAPALYVALGRAGYFPLDDTVLLRQLGSGFEGHPNRLKVPGVEISSGSLGQGLGAAVGAALAGKLKEKPYRVYCIMGDGEQQEGSIWEAVMAAGHYQLDNLCGILDKNDLQIDGWVREVMNVEPLTERYRSFGWNVIEVDGHDMKQIVEGYERAATVKGKPTVIIAQTVKGKGVSFMENQASWHGVAPNKEQFAKAIADLATPSVPQERMEALLKRAADNSKKVATETRAGLPKFARDYWWNAGETMKVEMDPTRMGFGRGLDIAGADERVVTIHADISSSIRITDFEAKHPERLKRVFSVGIAEQNMMSVAAGLASAGLIPVGGTYGVFAAGRAWDQIRTTICYSNLNVKIAGAHGGISVGPDGATHQALEEITLMSVLPNMHVSVPCDAMESQRATIHSLLEINGPVYIRFAREATPVVTTAETPFEFGRANVIRYRGAKLKFLEAFETVVAANYANEHERATIVACGPMVPEAMRAAWLLREEYGHEVRVLNVHTIKPLDIAALIAAAEQTGAILTAEEHQVGGFGNIVAGAILRFRPNQEKPLLLDMIGVRDRFGVSGRPWELVQAFGLAAEHIAERVVRLIERRQAGCAAHAGQMLTVVECTRCHGLTPVEKYLSEGPLPSDELCAECDRRAPGNCAVCRSAWLLSNSNFAYLCQQCRPAS